MCISFSSELPLSVISLKRLQYLLPKTFLTFWSGVYLWVCQIMCPTCLVPYTLSCLTCLLPYLLPCLTCLVPFLLLCLTCLVPYVLLCLTCFVFYMLSCLKCLLCLTCSRDLRASSSSFECLLLCMLHISISTIVFLCSHAPRGFFKHLFPTRELFWEIYYS